MKKILLIAAIAGVFTACGNGSESSTNSESTSTPGSSSTMTESAAPSNTDTSTNMLGTSSGAMGDTASAPQ